MLRLKGLTTDGFIIEHRFARGALLALPRKKGSSPEPPLLLFSPTFVLFIQLVLPSDGRLAIAGSYFNNCNARAVD
jgi:hypothetical protein